MQTRHSDILKINKGYSKRYMKSAIPSMQRILNKDKQKQLEALDKTDLKSLCVTNKLCLLGYIVVTINFIIIIVKRLGLGLGLGTGDWDGDGEFGMGNGNGKMGMEIVFHSPRQSRSNATLRQQQSQPLPGQATAAASSALHNGAKFKSRTILAK